MEKTCWGHMMASGRNGTLYLGVTGDLARRAWQHLTKTVEGFSARYNVTRLVWYESYQDVNEAISRETMLKKRRRAWKLRHIEEMNPAWDDLYAALNQ